MIGIDDLLLALGLGAIAWIVFNIWWDLRDGESNSTPESDEFWTDYYRNIDKRDYE